MRILKGIIRIAKVLGVIFIVSAIVVVGGIAALIWFLNKSGFDPS